MRALFKATFPTLCLMVFAVCVVSLLFIRVSQGWAGFAFLVFAVFIGIPLTGPKFQRVWRASLFGLSMIAFMVFSFLAMPYDPFGTPKPMLLTFAGQEHTIRITSYVRRTPDTSIYHYALYENSGGQYWILDGDRLQQTKSQQGQFIPAPPTEQSFFLEHYRDQVSEPDPSWQIGYFEQGRDASIAVTKQNMTFIGLLLFWVVLFILEQAHFQRLSKTKQKSR